MKESLSFYTGILDFDQVGTWPETGSPSYSIIKKEDIEISLSTYAGDGVPGHVVYLVVRHIDGLFQKYVSRGLKISKHMNSPVHQGPLNQTWGWREFYVTDPSGNTLRFGENLSAV